MIRQILLLAGLFISMQIAAQTGIGTTTPNASAKLDVFSDNKGFLPPRVSLSSVTDQSTIPSPATGLLVYCKGDAGLTAGYYFWNGNAWATIATAGGSGSFASSYLRGSRTANQSVAAGGIISFSAVDNTSGSDISLNTSDGKITLRPGNTYRLIAAVPNFTGSRPAFMWYNETTSSYIGSATNAYSPTDGASGVGAFGGIAEVIITPNVSTVLSFRLLSSLSSGAVTVGGLVDFSTTGSYPWFEAQVISGNAPVTGQSVDYVSVVRTTSQTVNTGDNLIFNTINSGNIPYNSSNGNFTLTAGKTYRLTGSVSLDGSNGSTSEIDIAWKTAAGDVLGNRALILSTNFASTAAGNGVTDIIYTPTINTTITLNVVYATANAKTVQNYTYATIEQIGSSAIINPWTLSGTNTYNTTGNVGIGTNNPTEKLDVTGTLGVSGTATLKDLVKIGTGIGDEGGEINFAVPVTNTTLSTRVVEDIWQNRFRIFDGNTNGVYIDLSKAPTGVNGELFWKSSGIVNAGTFVQLDNLKATITTSGSRSLSLATVSGSISGYIGGTFRGIAAIGNGASASSISLTTSASTAIFGWSFPNEGDNAEYVLRDYTNNRVYRINLFIGGSYNNNFISIERLH